MGWTEHGVDKADEVQRCSSAACGCFSVWCFRGVGQRLAVFLLRGCCRMLLGQGPLRGVVGGYLEQGLESVLGGDGFPLWQRVVGVLERGEAVASVLS